MMATRPQPVPKGEELTFIERAAHEELIFQVCRGCTARIGYPQTGVPAVPGHRLGAGGVGGHAAAAVQAGLCDYALVTYGSSQRSSRGKLVSAPEWSHYEQPYRMLHPLTATWKIAQRHMYEFRRTEEHLAEVAVSALESATHNPAAAPYQTPLAVEDVLSSPMISSPRHKLDYSPVTDWGAALVLTSAEQAADLAQPPVYCSSSARWPTTATSRGWRTWSGTRATDSAARAYRMTGVTPADIDCAHVYDASTLAC